MSDPLAYTPIAVMAVGHEEQMVHLNPGGWRRMMVPIYQPSERGRAIALSRVLAGKTLRRAAMHLGITPSTLSGLEQGRLTLPEDQWTQLLNAVQAWEVKR